MTRARLVFMISAPGGSEGRIYQYTNDGRVTVGDRVLYESIQGRIVFIVEESAFLPPYMEEEWAYLKEGLGVQWEDGTLFVLHDNYDDLQKVSVDRRT